MIESINLAEKLAGFLDHWAPRTAATCNRGVEHQPFAAEETHLLLLEPTGAPNTGDAATAAPRRTL